MSLSSENSQACKAFRAKLVELGAAFDDSAPRIVSRQADVGLEVTIKNTPVGQYPSVVSFVTTDGKFVNFRVRVKKIGGTLRRNWMKDSTVKDGNDWKSGYSNNTKYAPYVNNGHRIVAKGITWGWWPGVHMLERGITQALLHLQELFDVEINRIKARTGF